MQHQTKALHNLRMIVVGCPACFDNTPDEGDAHPTKQLKLFCNYATPNKWGIILFPVASE
ncbi:hypothetical protein [Microcoleus sp. AR_TQ3_B6]|uniref:hypothetical protein n=1 Tax=Microcoleus sp. AR_TQ3_B6 TaxID=3055284 RepID=UPI002FD001F7